MCFNLKQLLFLRDFVDLSVSRAGDGASRHLLERLETAETSKVTTRKTPTNFPEMLRAVMFRQKFVKEKLKE